MMMRNIVLVMALVMTVAAGSASADRFVVRVAGFVTYCPDSNEYMLTLEPVSGIMPATPQVLQTMTTPAPAPNPGTTLAAGAATTCGAAVTEPAQRLPGQTCELADACAPPAGPYTADAAFVSQMDSIYSSIGNAGERQAIYEWYLKEQGATGPRVGNGVTKFIIAIDRSPIGDSSARPDLLKPDATSGSPRSSNGVSIRTKPWGPNAGVGGIPQGTQMTIIPPADGPWYQVRSPQGNGWVCGLFCDLR